MRRQPCCIAVELACLDYDLRPARASGLPDGLGCDEQNGRVSARLGFNAGGRMCTGLLCLRKSLMLNALRHCEAACAGVVSGSVAVFGQVITPRNRGTVATVALANCRNQATLWPLAVRRREAD